MTVPGIVRRGVAARLEDSAPSWAASGRETALHRARCPRFARWRGAPADAPPWNTDGWPCAPPAVFSFGAGWLVVARRGTASREHQGATLARRGSVLATARGRPSNEVLYAGRFQIFNPPYQSHFFWSCAKRLGVASAPRTKHLQPPDYSSSSQTHSCSKSELGALRDHAWMKS